MFNQKLFVMKAAKYTKAVDHFIVNETDSEKYDTKARAFREIGKRLGLRADQVMGRYYSLKKGVKINTYEEFDPGNGKKFDRRQVPQEKEMPEVRERPKNPDLFESTPQPEKEATIFDATDEQDIAVEFRKKIVMSMVDQMKKPELMTLIQELIKRV